MRIFLAIMVILSCGLSKANAADACITGSDLTSNIEWNESFDDSFMHGAKIYKAAFSCQELDVVSNGLKASMLLAQVGALSTACTVGGIPVSVVLQGAVIGMGAIDLYVSNLDCVDETQEAKLKKQVDEAVCNALLDQGIECWPPLPLEERETI